jgi:hypothetical protein
MLYYNTLYYIYNLKRDGLYTGLHPAHQHHPRRVVVGRQHGGQALRTRNTLYYIVLYCIITYIYKISL